ncbi:uncharacterized protein [Clytia hemisphaerica]|uniref:Uncharacterized protein n=1 Tax=Clytia hemisphaerica TaxID=252671 RepID=A0A7M5X3A8_9CNID
MHTRSKMVTKTSIKVFFFLLCISAWFNPSEGNHGELSTQDLNDYMQDVLAEYQVGLRKTAFEKAPLRKRRSLDGDLQPENETKTYQTEISEIIPWATIPTTHPMQLDPFTIANEQYLTAVNFADQTGQHATKSTIYKLNTTSEKFEKFQDFSTSGAVDFHYVHDSTYSYAIFVDQIGKGLGGFGETYQQSFQLNQYQPEFRPPFQYRSRVGTLGATRVNVFDKGGYKFYLTANSYSERGNRYQVQSTLHVQLRRGFQLLQSFDTLGAQDVEVALIDNQRYIFFANHQDNSGSTDIYSYVYKEKEEHELTYQDNFAPYGLYQRIPTHGAKDFEYFTYNGHHYLVVCNEYTRRVVYTADYRQEYQKDYTIESVIFWWTGNLWVEWQRIPTNGAVKATYFVSEFGDPMLVIANAKAQATIYTYDVVKGIFKPTMVQGLSPHPDNSSFIPDVRSVSVFSAFNETFITVANYALESRNGTNIFKVQFVRNETESSAQTVPQMIKDLLERMKQELTEVKEDLESQLNPIINQVLTKTTNQTLDTELHISGNNINITNLQTEDVLYTGQVTPNPIKELAIKAAELKEKVTQDESTISTLQQQMIDLVDLDHNNVTIAGKKTFETIEANNVNIEEAYVTGLVDGTNITDLHQHGLQNTVAQTITGQYTFNEVVNFTRDLTVENQINDLYINEILTKTRNQTISGHLNFTDNVLIRNENLELYNNTVNGIRFENVLTLNTEQIISGRKTYIGVNFRTLETVGKVDGVNISDFAANKVSVTGSDILTKSIIFTNGFNVSSDVNVGGYVDGANITALWQSANSDQNIDEEIQGSKIFQNVTVKGQCNIESVNGKDFDNLALKNQTNNFTGKVVFNENVTVQEHLITNSNSTINNLIFQTDLVLSDGSHIITGHKTFESIHLMENVTVHGDINGVDLKTFVETVVQKGDNRTVTGKKHFHSTVNAEQLLTELVNNINVEELLNNVLVLVNGTKINASMVKFQSLNISSVRVEGTVNGLKIPDDLVLLSTIQHIEGSKTFTNNVTILNIHSINVIGDEDFSKFLREAAQNLPGQTVEANVTFKNSVTFTDEITTEKLNGQSVDNWLTTNTKQNITGTIRLLNDTTFTSSITTDVVDITGKVNGIDISDLEASAIYKNTSETINNTRLVFVNGIDCKQNLSVAGLINGVNLTELYHNTVRISKNQTVAGEKVFTNTVILKDTLTTSGTINNINLTKLEQESLKTVGDRTLLGNVTFINNVIVNGTLNAGGSIDGTDLNEFLENAAFVDSNGTLSINGSLTFNNVTANTVHTSTGVNGLSLNEILLQGVNQTLSGNVSFTNVSASSIQTELINGENLTDVFGKALKTTGDQNITGTYIFDDLFVEENLAIKTVNGVDFDGFLESAVPTNETSTLQGIIRFTSDVVIDQLETTKSLGDVNITRMLTDTLLKTGNQTICHQMEFENLTVGDGEFKGDVKTDLINNVNITKLYFDAVYLYNYTEQDIQGNLEFEELTVSQYVKADKINGFDLSNDFLLTTGNQAVSSNVKFNNSVVFESILVSTGFVDGVNLYQLDQDRIDLYDNITISGLKSFNNVSMTEIIVTDTSTVNGILPSDLVEINKTSMLTGAKTVTNLTVDDIWVTGNINGVDLVDFNNLVLRRDRVPFQLRADQIFTKDLMINGSLNVTGYINGQLVNGNHNYEPNVGDEIQGQLDMYLTNAGSLCGKISSLTTLAVAGAYLEGVEISSTIKLPSEDLGSIQSTIIEGKHYISIARSEVTATCGSAYILECGEFPTCTVLQSIQTNAVLLEFFLYNNQSALLVDHQIANETYSQSGCNKTTAEIYLWSPTNRIFEPYQSVNEELMESDSAPIIDSKGLLKRSLNKKLKEERVTSNHNGHNKTEIIDIKTFESKGNKFLIASVAKGSGGYLDVLKGPGNNVGSLKKSQRIVINSGRKNYVSVGKLNGKPVVSVSSSRRKDMKLHRFNQDTEKLEFYQQLPKAATSVKFQKVKQSEYILFASPETGFGLCPWQGASGYTDCEQLVSTDNNHVDTITNDSGAFVILGKPDSLKIYRVVIEGSGNPFDGDVC